MMIRLEYFWSTTFTRVFLYYKVNITIKCRVWQRVFYSSFNRVLHTAFFSSNSNCNNHIHYTNKTNMSNNKNHNNLIPISIPPRHINNNIKLAKSIFPTPTPIIQQIIPSIPSSHHKISALYPKTLQKHTSNITPTTTNPSVTKNSNNNI